MNDPHSIIVYKPPLVISRFDSADYTSSVPWRIRLNPLRYTITLFPGPKRWQFNRNSWMYLALADALYAIKKRYGARQR